MKNEDIVVVFSTTMDKSYGSPYNKFQNLVPYGSVVAAHEKERLLLYGDELYYLDWNDYMQYIGSSQFTEMTVSEYKDKLREHLNKIHADAPIICVIDDQNLGSQSSTIVKSIGGANITITRG